MAYQTFPWQAGSSRSFEKLLSLSLPALKGKTVLDVGCNAGYFCGWAAFQQAKRVVGIDRDCESIALARECFPECSFVCGDWNHIGRARFDLVLCLSAIHYAEDQQALLAALMNSLTPGGMLVLELGIAPGDEDAFVAVDRNMNAHTVDTRLFPTWAKIHALLSRHAFKYMGESVRQAGDPLPRHVFHVHRRRPLAVLLMDRHYSGKSSVVQQIMKPDIPVIKGEKVYEDIMNGAVDASGAIKTHVRHVENTRHMIPPIITSNICDAGLLPELADICMAAARRGDFILDHYIPPQYREQMCEIIDKAGFFVVALSLFDAYKPLWTKIRPAYSEYEAYTACLSGKYAIDEADYLSANPDVAQAVAEGRMPSGHWHYRHFGKREKRKTR
ncbi:MAG: methyltransferase domain-containing protein [Desulfovibrio sp.]|jgi:SAM-dependent methyltransferase|nr:methyltransferase domain-containing protein [Desulfovibrio sp.]